jgi:hypothetical protein
MRAQNGNTGWVESAGLWPTRKTQAVRLRMWLPSSLHLAVDGRVALSPWVRRRPTILRLRPPAEGDALVLEGGSAPIVCVHRALPLGSFTATTVLRARFAIVVNRDDITQQTRSIVRRGGSSLRCPGWVWPPPVQPDSGPPALVNCAEIPYLTFRPAVTSIRGLWGNLPWSLGSRRHVSDWSRAAGAKPALSKAVMGGGTQAGVTLRRSPTTKR